MQELLGPIRIEARFPLQPSDLQHPIYYRVLLKNAKPVEGTITLSDKLLAPSS